MPVLRAPRPPGGVETKPGVAQRFAKGVPSFIVGYTPHKSHS
jgi:hypothetical protein